MDSQTIFSSVGRIVMGGGTKSALLKKYVLDTILYKFDTKLALQYMKQIGHIDCSESYYFKVKRRVLSDEETNFFLNEHMKVGYARNHRLQIEETDRLKDHWMELFYQESSKPYMIQVGDNEDNTPKMINNPAYDMKKVALITTTIDNLNKSLDDLHNGSPLVHAIKQKIDEAMRTQHEKHNEAHTETS